MYQADLWQGKLTLGTGEVVDIYQAMQLGQRTMTREEDDEQDDPGYHEVDLTQEWSETEPAISSICGMLSKA
jgi:hypothetical protein